MSIELVQQKLLTYQCKTILEQENALKEIAQEIAISITSQWLLQALKIKTDEIDWTEAKNDIAKFLKPRELSTLDLWTKDFFMSRIEKLADYLG